MNKDYPNNIIGASGFVLAEECYEYNEDACYLADTKEAARQFMLICGYSDRDFRIDAVTLADIMKDYGYSSGEYAMEKNAFRNFKQLAKENAIEYDAEKFDLDSDLMVVNINNSQSAQYPD